MERVLPLLRAEKVLGTNPKTEATKLVTRRAKKEVDFMVMIDVGIIVLVLSKSDGAKWLPIRESSAAVGKQKGISGTDYESGSGVTDDNSSLLSHHSMISCRRNGFPISTDTYVSAFYCQRTLLLTLVKLTSVGIQTDAFMCGQNETWLSPAFFVLLVELL